MSEQNINVSIVPGEIRVVGPSFRTNSPTGILFSDVIVIDQRGGDKGWSLRGLFPNAMTIECNLMESAPGSAKGVSINTDVWLGIEKDDTVGPAGSTGGVYHFDIFVTLPLGINLDEYAFPVLEFRE